MKHILKYTFSFLLVCICTSVFAQVDTTKVIYPKKYGIRLGTDLNKIARNFYEDNYKGFEIVGDYRINKKIYIAAEVGLEEKFTEETILTNTTEGQYIKLGIDYNLYENWMDMNNMLYVGGRVGYATYKQTLHNYTIRDLNQYFPPTDNLTGKEFSGLNAVWLEFVAGVKVEVLNNLFLGASARLNFLASESKLDNYENLHIPGYNKKYSGDIGVGFNYTISYLIPFTKK